MTDAAVAVDLSHDRLLGRRPARAGSTPARQKPLPVGEGAVVGAVVRIDRTGTRANVTLSEARRAASLRARCTLSVPMAARRGDGRTSQNGVPTSASIVAPASATSPSRIC